MGQVTELFMIQAIRAFSVKRLWELRLYIVMGLDLLLLRDGPFLWESW